MTLACGYENGHLYILAADSWAAAVKTLANKNELDKLIEPPSAPALDKFIRMRQAAFLHATLTDYLNDH